MNPEYPVYIVSKGRAKSRQTSNALEKMGIPYHIVVEPQEYAEYAVVIAPEKILTLPFSDLGEGSTPARNWIWEHAIATGAKHHWILDDNIRSFCRYHNNKRIPVDSGTIFRCAEEFVDRYENVALSGFQYRCFATPGGRRPAFIHNTRIYSCILIKNDLPHRWRGRYNEDTDLSLRILKDGYSTILFQAFLQDKAMTMTMAGGNTNELYKGEGRLCMAQSLADQHPDVVRVTSRWGRAQHLVNYKPFKANKLIKKHPSKKYPLVDEHGMKLKFR